MRNAAYIMFIKPDDDAHQFFKCNNQIKNTSNVPGRMEHYRLRSISEPTELMYVSHEINESTQLAH